MKKEKIVLGYSVVVLLLAMMTGVGVQHPGTRRPAAQTQTERTTSMEQQTVAWWSLLYPEFPEQEQSEERPLRFWLFEQLRECFT